MLMYTHSCILMQANLCKWLDLPLNRSRSYLLSYNYSSYTSLKFPVKLLERAGAMSRSYREIIDLRASAVFTSRYIECIVAL